MLNQYSTSLVGDSANYGADEGIRTLTPLRTLVSETSASTIPPHPHTASALSRLALETFFRFYEPLIDLTKSVSRGNYSI